MAGEVSGIDVLIYINMAADPVNDAEDFVILGGQRGMTLKKITEVADAKHKSSGQWPNRVPTFLDWSVTGDMVKITGDPTQEKLETLWRARENVHVRVLKEDGDAEQGFAVIADKSEQAPHDNVDTISLDFQGNSSLDIVLLPS